MPDGGEARGGDTAGSRFDRARLRVPILIALGVANVLVSAWVRSASGPDAIAIELASSPFRFSELFAAPTGGLDQALIEGARSQLARDYVFIAVYTAGLVMLVATTGRRRPLGRRAPTSLAIGAALTAGLFDVFENLATSRALDQLVAGEVPDAGRVTELAMVKWILVAAVGAYVLVRALGTPRRRRTRDLGRRYRLRGSRDDLAAAAAAKVAAAAPAGPDAAAARAEEPPGLMAQLQIDDSVDRVTDSKVVGWIDGVAQAVGRWGSSVIRSLFIDPPPDDPPVDLEGPAAATAGATPSGRRRRAGTGPISTSTSGCGPPLPWPSVCTPPSASRARCGGRSGE